MEIQCLKQRPWIHLTYSTVVETLVKTKRGKDN